MPIEKAIEKEKKIISVDSQIINSCILTMFVLFKRAGLITLARVLGRLEGDKSSVVWSSSYGKHLTLE